MNSLSERSDIPQSELQSDLAASSAHQPAYQPPSLTLLGNAHDLLAMAKTLSCDSGVGSAGEFFPSDPACDDPG